MHIFSTLYVEQLLLYLHELRRPCWVSGVR